MFEEIFNIKNDRRLSIYLYRSGMLVWCLYLLAGAPALIGIAEYRNHIGALSGLMLILSFYTHMVYESTHHKAAYQQKKKWFLIGTVFAGVLIYVIEFRAPSLLQIWVSLLHLLD